MRATPHGNSLLTSAQREFIEESDHNDRTSADISQKRTGIRRRFRDALLDYQLLMDNPSEVQFDRLLNAQSEGVSEQEATEIRDGVISAIGIFWLLSQEDDRMTSFNHLVESGVQQGILVDGYESDVFVQIDISHVEPVREVIERARDKDPADYTEMTVRELNALLRAGEISDPERAIQARFEAMRQEGHFDNETEDEDR